MNKYRFALLIENDHLTFNLLKRALKKLGMDIYCVQTCKAAEALIRQCEPALVFADSSLGDGSWSNILDFAEEAEVPLNVIVVSGYADTKRYLSVLEHGAFDYIVPPFEHSALDFVVRSAQLDVRRRREGLAGTAVA
jgi:DNA-binding NtrC family response regulator